MTAMVTHLLRRNLRGHCHRALPPALLLLLLLAARPAAAWRRYLDYAPNADAVPCPASPAAAGAGCHGAPLCEAWGHEGCAPLAPANVAGASLRRFVESAHWRGWSALLCGSDSDGDGLTDGDELGDGCCAWPTLPPQTRLDLSHPSERASVSRRASCLANPAPAPANVSVAPCGAGCALFSLAPPPPPQSACVCELRIEAAVNGGGGGGAGGSDLALGVPGTATSFALCGLPPGASVSAVAFALNGAGDSDGSEPALGAARSESVV